MTIPDNIRSLYQKNKGSRDLGEELPRILLGSAKYLIYCYHSPLSPEDAEECASDAVQILLATHRKEELRDCFSYLRHAVKIAALRWKQKRYKRVGRTKFISLNDYDVRGVSYDGEEELNRGILWKEVQEKMLELSPEQQEAIQRQLRGDKPIGYLDRKRIFDGIRKLKKELRV